MYVHINIIQNNKCDNEIIFLLHAPFYLHNTHLHNAKKKRQKKKSRYPYKIVLYIVLSNHFSFLSLFAHDYYNGIYIYGTQGKIQFDIF